MTCGSPCKSLADKNFVSEYYHYFLAFLNLFLLDYSFGWSRVNFTRNLWLLIDMWILLQDLSGQKFCFWILLSLLSGLFNLFLLVFSWGPPLYWQQNRLYAWSLSTVGTFTYCISLAFFLRIETHFGVMCFATHHI